MLTLVAPVGSLEAGASLDLPSRQGHHVAVRRMAMGDAVRLIDGAGAVAEGRITALGDGVTVTVAEVRVHPRPVTTTLAVGAGDRDRFAWMVEKATELGVTRIVPLETERCRSVASRVRDSHIGKFRLRATESLKQCGGAWDPEISSPLTLDRWVEGLGEGEGERWFGLHEAAPGVEPIPPDRAVTLVVGPEGGLTEAEQRQLRAHHFKPVGVGPNVLRFETAAVALAALAAALRQS